MKALQLLETLRDDYIHGELTSDIEEAIKELEDLETKDRLAQLEKVMLDYYLAKGYQVGVGGWQFVVNISTSYKRKEIQIRFRQSIGSNWETVFRIDKQSTKEMFDKAIEHFNIKR